MPVFSVDYTGEIINGIVEVGHLASVRIGNARLIADFIVGIGNRITLVVGHLLEAAKQIKFKGVCAGPVVHLHQLADLVVLIGDFFCSIIIDFLDQIKGSIGVLRYIAIGVDLGDHVPIAVVDIDGAVAKRIDLACDEIAAIILVESDLVGVNAVERVYTMEGSGD